MRAQKSKLTPQQEQEYLNSMMNADIKSIVSPLLHQTDEELSGQIREKDMEESVSENIAGNDMTKGVVEEISDDAYNEVSQTKPRTGIRKRKSSFEEYKKLFLETPKIEDRKTVFISGVFRDKLDEVSRKLGGRKMSVSGFIENLVRHHLEVYEEDLNAWKKL